MILKLKRVESTSENTLEVVVQLGKFPHNSIKIGMSEKVVPSVRGPHYDDPLTEGILRFFEGI